MQPHQLKPITAAALSALALLAFAAPAQSQDLRSPDARDAAERRQTSTAAHDLRSPDARDAAWQSHASETAGLTNAAQDIRSPDAHDAGLVAQGLIERPGAVSTAPPPAAPHAGFDWGDAAIGAAGALALALLATGAIIAVRRRWHRSQPATAA